MRLFVFGHGYSASRFVETLKPASVDRKAVTGVTVRSRGKAVALAAHGLTPFVFDGEHPADGIAPALFRATHLLVSIPPGHAAPAGASVGGANARPGDPALRWYADEIAHGSPNLEWIGYLSTVGVYGDHEGAWIDEGSETRPVSERSRARIAAEAAWQAVAKTRGVPLAILRLSGIYGPGRNGFVNLARGTAKRLVKPGQVFNRIHVDDIAGALALLAGERLGGVFNVSDDEPAPPQDVVTHAAELAGIAPPPEGEFDAAELSTMARSFYGENKRVSNARIKAAGYRFRYPTYREGLAGLVGDFRSAQQG
ncbi:SDR family oxidoreductase [Aurantimonas marianensis]|uniref:SDR family oxidoreductase n=1 Tax=Aurantimonas marianensis TaxID=2920428 RepID=A0A9X2H8Q7_9HYPH|nr:SDR family oxidoreductase [Aurantimonas marianensis]MCP3055843.1 SDR family oxidoreductase [Aurantimonas marianensis]